ncbi:MAG: glucokinase [Alphaproteobacteria bacterium]|nr:glucokinase [Alphaproteobacteria bacterium]
MQDVDLVADIGGTNARFALAARETGRIVIREPQNFRAVDFETVRDAADAYLEAVGATPTRACFAAAGPLIGGEVKFSNSPWVIREAEIVNGLRLRTFRIVNDFYALAAGVAHLDDEAFVSVRGGEALGDAPQLVIGPGTGLGQALIVPTESGPKVVSTEGGHVTFAPRTDEEFAVMKFIAREHPRVSAERLLSGRGLVNIHRALCALADTPRVSLAANEITEAAISGAYPIAARAVDMFCDVLGRVAGDAVLATGARGGVFLGGGILPKIRDIFLKSGFAEKFLDKGRMRTYLEPVPVRMIVREGAALYGAASSIPNAPMNATPIKE